MSFLENYIVYVQTCIWKIFTEIVIKFKNLTRIEFQLLFIFVFQFSDLFELFPMEIYYFMIPPNFFPLWKKLNWHTPQLCLVTQQKLLNLSLCILPSNKHPILVITLLTNNYFTSNNYFTQTLFQLGIAMRVAYPRIRWFKRSGLKRGSIMGFLSSPCYWPGLRHHCWCTNTILTHKDKDLVLEMSETIS